MMTSAREICGAVRDLVGPEEFIENSLMLCDRLDQDVSLTPPP